MAQNEAYGWHFQYLTVIGLTLSTLTFIVALLADVTLSRRLFLIKNLMSVCCAPMEVLISVLYWGLRMLSTTGRIGLFSLSAIVMALSTVTLKQLYGHVNGFGNDLPPQSRPGDIKKKERL
ncbi:hypothetical protein F1880_001361 [Penicillium rolfsii]|nr:hypothetical protein F1880_001361 [Penicillium rolfsii]